VAIRVRLVVQRTELGRGRDDEDVMCRERELRRVAHAEDGNAAVARDEAEGKPPGDVQGAFVQAVYADHGPGFVSASAAHLLALHGLYGLHGQLAPGNPPGMR